MLIVRTGLDFVDAGFAADAPCFPRCTSRIAHMHPTHTKPNQDPSRLEPVADKRLAAHHSP